METKIFKVIRQGEAFNVSSKKQESGQLAKCVIQLRELGSPYEDEYVAAMLGKLASCRFYENDVVAARLRFSTREHDGQVYQDITVADIVKVKE